MPIFPAVGAVWRKMLACRAAFLACCAVVVGGSMSNATEAADGGFGCAAEVMMTELLAFAALLVWFVVDETDNFKLLHVDVEPSLQACIWNLTRSNQDADGGGFLVGTGFRSLKPSWVVDKDDSTIERLNFR